MDIDILNRFKKDLNVKVENCKDITEIFEGHIQQFISPEMHKFSKEINQKRSIGFIEEIRNIFHSVAEQSKQSKKYKIQNVQTIRKKFPFLNYNPKYEFISTAYLDNGQPFLALYGVQGFLGNEGAYMILQGKLNKVVYKNIHTKQINYNPKTQIYFLTEKLNGIKTIPTPLPDGPELNIN